MNEDYIDNNIPKLKRIGILPNNHLRGLVQNLSSSLNSHISLYEYDFGEKDLSYTNAIFKKYCDIKKSIPRNEILKLTF